MDGHQQIVVLGGGHTSDQELPLTSQLNNDSLVRLIEGIRLYRKFPDTKLILSGGSLFDPIPNADNLRKSEKAIHEYFGIFWAKRRGQL